MDLNWHLWGWVRLRLTSADCTARLRDFSQEMRLEDVQFLDELTVEFTIPAGKRPTVSDSETLEQVGRGGGPVVLEKLWHWRIFAAAVVLMLGLTIFLPTRIWFVEVEGNGTVPVREIIEEARSCGVYFGASRRELRSEQVKNHLLKQIPELSWAGVNTSGCTACITVRLRDDPEPVEEQLPGSIYACTDAVVTAILPTAGTALVTPGQAVREGEMLISGVTDLGRVVRLDRAEGEVWGLTKRSITIRLPEMTLQRSGIGKKVSRRSLLIGKFRVNFYNDSGILHGTCGKMRTVNYLSLPGGFQLPVALVTEEYELGDSAPVLRADASSELADQARRLVLEQMTAGTIEGETLTFDGTTLTAVFDCREMIGVFRAENDTKGE